MNYRQYSNVNTTAIIAMAGNGTRFMPATDVVPKEMFPILNRPVVQILIDEIRASGIHNIVIVANKKYKRIVKDYFKGQNIKIIYQTKRKYGNAIPALEAKKYIKNDFIYIYGDDLVLSEIPACRQLLDMKPPAMLVAEVNPKEASSYGIVEMEKGKLIGIEEKPENPKSNLISFGRFFAPKELLEEIKIGRKGEYWFVDAVNKLNKKIQFNVKRVLGRWLTIGDPKNYIKTLNAYQEKWSQSNKK